MRIEHTGIKHFENIHRQQLQVAPKRSGDLPGARLRVALAATFLAWARKLAPEMTPPIPVRTAVTKG